MKLLMAVLMVLATNAQASDKVCVETIHGKLCGVFHFTQDSSIEHVAYSINEFSLNDVNFVKPNKFSSNFLCRAFAPDFKNTRPQESFGKSKLTEREVVRWTMYRNGDCRPTRKNSLKSIDCYADVNENVVEKEGE